MSTIAFSFIILATWEGTSGLVSPRIDIWKISTDSVIGSALRAGLLNGGPSALVCSPKPWSCRLLSDLSVPFRRSSVLSWSSLVH